MHQPFCATTKSQHLDGFGAQKCHARRIRLGPDTNLGEVAAQVCAQSIQNLCHLSADGAIVRFTPESASKTASLVVSNANSTDCPTAAFDSAVTLATN